MKDKEIDHVEKEKHGPHPVNTKVLQRLKSIEGQVRGIRQMVEDEKYCIDIITQISAVRAALNKAGILILRRHIETCVTDAIRSDEKGKKEILNELFDVLDRAGI